MTVTEVEPSAPTANDDAAIPTVTATTLEADTAFVPTASAVVAEDDTTPAKSCPPGMKMKTVTTTYPDGRKVTTTEFVPEGGGTAAASAAPPTATATPAAAASTYHPPRRDLGSAQATVQCPYCNHNGVTRTNQQCGECTWISVIILLLLCFPFAWIPLVCPSCYDTEHFCRNCGKQVGWSKADCCNN